MASTEEENKAQCRRTYAGLLQDREEAGNPVRGTGKQGAAAPCRSARCPRFPLSLPPQAVKRDFATALRTYEEMFQISPKYA